MDLHQTLTAALIVLAGSLLQGTVAFGFGLFSVPLLLMVGLPVPEVLAISATCTAVQSANGVHHLRQTLPWGVLGASVAVRGLTMLLGIWTLSALVTCSQAQLKFWIGLVMLLLVLLQTFWQPTPRPKLHPGWDAAAFLTSGYTGGLCAMGGPPMVMWVMAHDWTAERTRAFLFATFMSLVPLQLAALYWTFGGCVLRGMLVGAVLTPAVLLGSRFGLRIGARFSKPKLRRLAFAVLVVIALNAMAPLLLRLLRGEG